MTIGVIVYVRNLPHSWNDALPLAEHFSEKLQNYGVLLVA